MTPSIEQVDESLIGRLADQAELQYGELADEYAAARAEAARQAGSELRSEEWKQAGLLLQRRHKEVSSHH